MPNSAPSRTWLAPPNLPARSWGRWRQLHFCLIGQRFSIELHPQRSRILKVKTLLSCLNDRILKLSKLSRKVSYPISIATITSPYECDLAQMHFGEVERAIAMSGRGWDETRLANDEKLIFAQQKSWNCKDFAAQGSLRGDWTFNSRNERLAANSFNSPLAQSRFDAFLFGWSEMFSATMWGNRYRLCRTLLAGPITLFCVAEVWINGLLPRGLR